jgi:hypothetical protein
MNPMDFILMIVCVALGFLAVYPNGTAVPRPSGGTVAIAAARPCSTKLATWRSSRNTR